MVSAREIIYVSPTLLKNIPIVWQRMTCPMTFIRIIIIIIIIIIEITNNINETFYIFLTMQYVSINVLEF